MKALFFSLSILYAFSSFAQSRSRIINQIKHYKYSVYEKEVLKASYDEFTPIILEYFKQKGFLFAFNNDSSLTFKKKVPIIYKYDDSFTSIPRGRHGAHEKGRANFFVTADLTPVNGKIKYPLINACTQEYVIAHSPIRKRIMIGIHKFNTLALYDFLHYHFYNENLKLSDHLTAKVDGYNRKIKKERKKLISGRDF